MKELSVVFMGTPEFAIPVLDMLIKNTNVKLVVSQPDKLVGRKKELTFSPVKQVALDNNIEVFQPRKIREDYQKILDINPDIIITCAYGQIIPKILIDAPKFGCINVHASLLPKLRGASPINHAIIDGYKKTGVTIMYMDENMDTGDIISTFEYEIKDDETYGSLSKVLSINGAILLENTLKDIINNCNKRIKQDDSLSTTVYTIKREEEHIDFNKSVIDIDRLVRGLNPYPLANLLIDNIEYKIVSGHYEIKNCVQNKINILTKKEMAIGCRDGLYYIDIIKPSGKKEMPIKDFLNGVDIDSFKNKEIK
ncbi:MAG: methionyl-tRNA formyltransferase [Bacilli bacterium]|nr:methionyl-tRNA formyltransferase [Bacilli bacterium]